MTTFADELDTKHERKTGARGALRFLALAKLDEQTCCLLRFLLDPRVQGEIWVGDANLGVIST